MKHSTPIPQQAEDFPFEFSEAAFARIRQILRERRNFDIGSYKDKYMKRRIAIRVRATHAVSATVYSELLAGSERELDALLKGLTIHVSHFFRNRSTFGRIRDEVLPALFARLHREGRAEATFWSVGCSSGEEPYSLAILLKDSFPEELNRLKISVVATDINEGILDAARRGGYPPDRLHETPPEVVTRHFTANGGKFHLAPDIRSMVAFRRGDLFDYASYLASDLILCRNVLIYFEREEQERILMGLAASLPAGGILVLGKAETLVGESRRRFVTVCPVERIYQKNRLSLY
ncbi:CheR family methyltransferase [Geobacter pickeringii]|uniref:protein-glutamate O-methyltransferase n=1 Tax=Geobacter pickeringii TaxID=345632 RepID=A0A0B5BH09_9BACT|nr:protein-glutamate O-methyltransferase CheR [Geobacter pickeringii]AJE04444.1 chemotaxis protein CheR [Geobacter pickeringii]